MPYLRVETNQQLEQERAREIATTLSAELARMLGKPEGYVMINLQPGAVMTFAGSDEPAAYLVLGSIGLRAEDCPQLSRQLCQLVEKLLGVAGARTYIDFRAITGNMFGFDGRTF